MKMERNHLFFPFLFFISLSAFPAFAEQSDHEIRLVLQLTVDGLRADLLKRPSARFGEGGFNRLIKNGVVFKNAHYQHANTETIVGHATLATGANPSVHGMTGNVWLDKEASELSYNIEDAEFPLIPTRNEVRTATRWIPLSNSRAARGVLPARCWLKLLVTS